MRNITSFRWAMVLFLLLLASPVAAGPRDHVDGFFLRLSSGVGTASTSLDDSYQKWEMSGTATDVNIAIGGVIMPNLAIHGTLLGWIMSDPQVDIDGVDQGDLNGDLTTTGFGAGLTYYFMPANLYLSGTLGSGSMELDGGHDLKGETDQGVLLDFTLGKEWWVGDKWGLGAAVGAIYHNFNDGDVDQDWSGWSYCLRFSATMN